MIIEKKGEDYYYISLVDLHLHDGTSGTYVRSFNTSAEVIDWVKNHFGQVFIVVRPDEPGAPTPKLKPQSYGYELAYGDVIVGDMMVYDTYGLRVAGKGSGTG